MTRMTRIESRESGAGREAAGLCEALPRRRAPSHARPCAYGATASEGQRPSSASSASSADKTCITIGSLMTGCGQTPGIVALRDVAQGLDGSLYIAESVKGKIWRVICTGK